MKTIPEFTPINEFFSIHTGTDRHNRSVYSLVKTHYKYGDNIYKLHEPDFLKTWYDYIPTYEEVENEMILNDWTRWNTELKEGQKVEISEAVYYHLLGCVPPIKMNGTYFEVGEPHHHDNKGCPVHRACWIENDKYYTGYPKNYEHRNPKIII